MTAEFTPKAAFRAFAAKILGVAPDDLEGGANDARTASAAERSRGAAWQFEMWSKTEPFVALRGWVTADGTIITADQNLALLFAEQGVWARPANQTPDDLANRLAEDLVWSYGAGVTLETMRAFGLGPPELTLAPDGSGTLRFFSNDHGGAKPGMGGGAPPDTYSENNAVLTADHKVALTRSRFRTHRDR